MKPLILSDAEVRAIKAGENDLILPSGVLLKTIHQCRNLDGKHLNNLPENLKWGTRAENYADRLLNGAPFESPSYNFTTAERSHIVWAVEHGLCSRRHVARVFGINPALISGLIKRWEEVRPPSPPPVG